MKKVFVNLARKKRSEMNQENRLKGLLRREEYRNKWVTCIDGKVLVKDIQRNNKLKIEDILTSKQLEVYNIAIKEGYFDIPKKTSQFELAKKLGIKSGTLCLHLQKIVEKIIKYLI